jgi:predicted transcriptional regulator
MVLSICKTMGVMTMPFTAQQLIEDHQKIITASPDLSAKQALELMIQHDFSQLPVIDENNILLGIVTSDSILRALNHFGVPLADLKVSHAIAKAKRYTPDDDLFDLLDALKDTYAVLIVQNDDTLKSIVTSYDTTEYFRRRAEDIMYVEDIESTVKDFIRIAFNHTDDIDQHTLNKAIAELMGSDNYKKFQSALKHYLSRADQNKASFDQDLFEEVFAKHFVGKNSAKLFDELTLYEYIQLLSHKSKWPAFKSIFQLEVDAVRNLLNGVRETRNALAHFHGEISPSQREQLHFCAGWLEQRRTAVAEAFQANPPATEVQEEAVLMQPPETIPEPLIDKVLLTEENATPNDSRYAPLAIWLQQQPLKPEKLLLTFKQIEEILGEELPTSARQHRSWWANDSVGHVQSQQWLEVGWRVSSISITDERVTFTRIKDREKMYIDFYSELLPKLAKAAEFPIRDASPDGLSWILLGRVPNLTPFEAMSWQLEGLPPDANSVAGFLGYSFARHRRFRTEFYLDSGDKERNKSLYDKLYSRKSTIQAALEGIPGSLEWERIDDKRASRIALYHKGTITDRAEELAQLRRWAVDAMVKFQKVIDQQIREVLLHQQIKEAVEQQGNEVL